MLRALIYTLLGVLVITFLRGVVGIIAKALSSEMAGLFKEEGERAGAGSRKSAGEFGGELVKDPVCGTFVSAKSRHTKTIDGKTYSFCSRTCRDRFLA
jgi:YHS domain-containing protein